VDGGLGCSSTRNTGLHFDHKYGMTVDAELDYKPGMTPFQKEHRDFGDEILIKQ